MASGIPQPVTPGSARATSASGANARGVIVNTIKRGPSMLPAREKILLAADSASGKTYAWLRMARAEFLKGQRDPDYTVPRFYVIDTDDAMPKFLSDGQEFDYLYHETGGNVYPFPSFNWGDYYASWNYISEKAQTGDWLVIDVINRAYDQAQWRLAEYQGNNLDEEVARRSLNNEGFGGFSGKDWNVVTRMFNSVFDPAIHHPKLNVMFIAHITDMVDAEGREKREALTLFDDVGLKPRGPRAVYELVDTVIVAWAKRVIDRNQGRRVGNATTIRKLALVKDRGLPVADIKTYDRDLWDAVLDIRREYRERRAADPEFSSNITDPKTIEEIERQAKLDAEAAGNPDEPAYESGSEGA